MKETNHTEESSKDILLNAILHEIEEENCVEETTEIEKTEEVAVDVKEEEKKERHPLLQALFYFVALLIFLLFLYLLYTITVEGELQERAIEQAKSIDTSSHATQKVKKIVHNPRYDINDFSKKPFKKHPTDTSDIKDIRSSSLSNIKTGTEHERAKSLLLEQMKQ